MNLNLLLYENFQAIRKIRYILTTAVCVVGFLYFSLLLLVSLPDVKTWMAGKFKETLAESIGSRVEVSGVSLDLFNHASIDGLVIYDQRGVKMLDVGSADISFDCLPLIDGTLRLSSVKVRDGEVKLYKTSKDSKLNCQFVIDSLSSKGGGGGFEVKLGSLVAKNIKVYYDVLDEPETKTFIDKNHIAADNLNCSLLVKCMERDSLSLRMRNLDFSLKNGLSAKQLCASIAASKRSNCVSVSLKRGTVSYRNILSSLNESYLRMYTNDRGDNFVSSLAEAGLNVNVEIAGRYKYAISSSVAKSTKDAMCPIETFLSVRYDGRQLAKVHAFVSCNLYSHAYGDYDVDVRRDDLTPVFRVFNLDLPISAYLGSLTNLENKASFRIDGDDFVWKGLLKTNVGELAHNVKKVGGRVSYDLNLNNFEFPSANGVHDLKVFSASLEGVAVSKQVGKLAFPKLLNAQMSKDLVLSSKVAIDGLQSPQINLNHVLLSVGIDKGVADVVADVEDPKVKLHSTVKCEVSKLFLLLQNGECVGAKERSNVSGALPFLHAKASVDHIDADLLKPFVGKMFRSFAIKDLEVSYADGSNFRVNLNDYSCRYKDGRSSAFGDLSLSCNSSSNVCKYDLRADSCSGHLVTNMSFDEIVSLCRQQLATHFPSLDNAKTKGEAIGFADLNLKIMPGSVVSELLKDQIEWTSPVFVDASVSGKDKISVLTAVTPRLNYNGTSYRDVSLYCNNKPDSLTGSVMFTKLLGKDSVRVEVPFVGNHDVLYNELKWKTGNVSGTHGSVAARTSLTRDETGHICCNVKVLPSKFFVRDTVWNISPTDISYCGNKFSVDRFCISRQNQHLNFSAAFSDEVHEVLLELNDVEIAYIVNILNFKPLEFSGRAFGVVRNQRNGNLLDADLTVKNFCFNTGNMGTMKLNGLVDMDGKTIKLNATTQRSDEDSTLIDGLVDVGNNKLNLFIKSEKTNLQFLNKYVRGFVSDLEGTVSGDFHLFGDLRYLNMEGRHRVNYMKFRPKMLGVLYTFEGDSLHIRPDTIDFGGMALRDPYGNTAKISGSLNHHSLFRFDYKLKFDLDGLELIDWKQSPQRSFGGKVFADGNVGIYGNFKKINIGGELSTAGNPGSSVLYYNSETSSSDEDLNRYIRFVDRQEKDELSDNNKEEKLSYSLKDNSTDVYINFKFNVNPNATLNIVTDPTTNDLMALNGSGALSMNYYNKGKFLLNGLYSIDGGNYKLTIKDIIRKNFIIQPGGYLRFNGSLSDGDINIKGVHKINSVSLSDLNVGASYSNSTIGADCILNFTGKMSEPKVSFGLDFPNANTDENKIIKNILLTEEDRNMQAVYLLSIGRFYTYNYNSFNTSGQSQSSVAMTSFLAGTLSGQINNLLQDAFHINNWNFDTNIAAGRMGWDDMEVQGSLSGKMFNNRLLFNGNIGYRDQITTYSNNFVGNFNLRWFLNKSGSVSLKAYSETNDRYFTKTTLTTQGGGIMFRKDFDKLRFFFNRKDKK